MPATVVMIHGLRGRSDEWMPQRLALEARGHTVLTPDLPGHGARSREPFSVGEALATVAETVTGCPEPPLLVGRALGAHVAIEVAAAGAPVRGLVAIGCGTEALGWLDDSNRIAFAAHQVLPDRGAALGALSATRFSGSVPRHTRRSEPDQFLDTLRQLSSFDSVTALRRIDAPVWLVNGQFDLFRMQERAFLAATRSGTLVRQPGARLARGIRDPRMSTQLLLDIADAPSRRPGA
ncbi:MAG: hydrolase or acyltransferase (alpha/beta hydrolase superfamily)-like protein [Microbacteriaceae bacterium]|nr:hydrolase or acyltransferase (alpha/beta hydrolase superfamily)-like protein [Microbacteriaceae bacterium]